MTKFDTHTYLQEHLQDETKNIMESIRDRGLCSLKALPADSVTPTSVLQTQNVNDRICVNFLNLKGASDKERQDALQLAMSEEYCGVAGICIERRWPFESQTELAVQREVQARLMQSLVFILTPPTKNAHTLPARFDKGGVEAGTYVATYSEALTGEALSCEVARSRLLTLPNQQSIIKSQRIMEMKTSHRFPMDEVYAILVPEPLYPLAKQVFSSEKLISVKATAQTYYRLPEILDYMHGCSIEGCMQLTVPDYSGALQAWLTKEKQDRFSIHAVRLPTQFDWTLRAADSLALSPQLAKESRAKKIVLSEQKNGPWFFVHKAYASDLNQVVERLEKQYNGGNLISSMREGSAHFLKLAKQWREVKGTSGILKLNRISDAQYNYLCHLGVSPIPHPFQADAYYVFSSTTQHAQVKRVVESFSQIQQEAQASILRHTQGFWARKQLGKMHVAHQQVCAAQERFEKAFKSLKM